MVKALKLRLHAIARDTFLTEWATLHRQLRDLDLWEAKPEYRQLMMKILALALEDMANDVPGR